MASVQVKCFKCGINYSEDTGYYNSNSILYEHLKKLPICKDCVDSIYQVYFQKFQDEKLALYQLCKKLDMPFHHSIFEGTLKKGSDGVTKHYFRILNSFRDRNGYADDFDGGDKINEQIPSLMPNDFSLDNINIDIDTQIFWGFGFKVKDYLFLETEIAKWKQTHKCDNQAELTLLKEICVKILEIRNKREASNDVSKDLKDLQDLMKTASVDPAKSNAINSGENVDRFGVWIKDIERLKPAEWFEQQEKYKDMDGFLPYIKDYILRPIRNFFSGTKDFLINGENLAFEEKEEDANE